MSNTSPTDSQRSTTSSAPPNTELPISLWQRVKGSRISYLTLPLILVATVVEFVILATGWKYQQVVCVPQGMGVVLFGIGPIGATILAVELLKLPLAVWTASRVGWRKMFMLIVGLPLICLLTFQLVKDMAVYEMGIALEPASLALEKATQEEIKIEQLKAELANQIKDDAAVRAVIETKQADRDRKLAELAARQAQAKAEIEESLRRNDATREDAITLTDYQKNELAEAEARQATIIKQFDADAAQLTKAIEDLRTRREAELARATTWNAEEARIENDYQAKMFEYTNKKAAYEKSKAEYDSANFLKRKFLKKPVDPGVPPVRESNKILKPTLVAEIEAQIQAKEAELIEVNNKRRDRVAQVDADARRLREEFSRRSGTKREETDHKREELIAAMALLVKEGAAEAKLINEEFARAVEEEESAHKNQRPVELIRAELDASRETANGFYEEREAAIRQTQVHRIATTVEIVRGWLFGERPVSITASAKERGDLLTDQISMVRIWVYPVLAFIVAFLPTLMVEVGFSTLFKPERRRRHHRVGFFGRGLYGLYVRAGRQRLLRAERVASEAAAAIASRDSALASAKVAAQKSLSEKDAELQAAREAIGAAEAKHEEQMKQQEDQWRAKLAEVTDALNQALAERNTLHDFQQTEIERQVQLRENAWSERLNQARQELEAQRTSNEAERTAMTREHHKKLQEVTEDWKSQLTQARRQLAEAESAWDGKSTRLADELRETLKSSDAERSQLQMQVELLSHKLTQSAEDASREREKTARQEKQRLSDVQTQAERELRRREVEFERQLEARSREADIRLKEELQQQELAFHEKLTHREQELINKANAREAEIQNQWASDLQARQEEWERQIESRVRAAETRLSLQTQQKEELLQSKLRERDQYWQAKLEAVRVESQTQTEQELRRRDAELAESKQREREAIAQQTAQAQDHQRAAREWEKELDLAHEAIKPLKALLARTEKERDEARQSASEGIRNVQDLEKQLMEVSSFLAGWSNGKPSRAA